MIAPVPDNNILLDHSLDNSTKAGANAVCDGENVYIIGIMEYTNDLIAKIDRKITDGDQIIRLSLLMSRPHPQ